MQDTSRANFIKMQLGGQNHQRGYDYCVEIDLSRPSLLILGGATTNSEICAYNYITRIENALQNCGITGGLDIYAAYYRLENGRSSSQDIVSTFKTKFDMNSQMGYFQDIYEFAFEPRAFDQNENFLSPKNTEKNFRNLMLFAHCFGTSILTRAGYALKSKLHDYYSAPQINTMLKNTLAVNHAPCAPLNTSGFSEVSFLSARDDVVRYYAPADHIYIRANPDKFQPSFFPDDMGNMMIVNRIKNDDIYSEHGIEGLDTTNRIHPGIFSENGKILMETERNALVTGVRAMIAGEPVPTTAELIDNEYANYKKLVKTGQRIIAETRTTSRLSK